MKKHFSIIISLFIFVIIVSMFFAGCADSKSEPTMAEICKGKNCIECGNQAESYSIMATHPSTAYKNPKNNSFEKQSGSFYRVYYCNDCAEKRTVTIKGDPWS